MSFIQKIARKWATSKSNQDSKDATEVEDKTSSPDRPPKKKSSTNQNSQQRRGRGDSSQTKRPRRRGGRPSGRDSGGDSGGDSRRQQLRDGARRSQPQPQPKGSPSTAAPKAAVDPKGFLGLGLGDKLLQALGEQGYENPTPIQKASIADLVAGRDLFGCAQTGTGKTAAFALPSLERLSRKNLQRGATRILVLAPTRELALQVSESYKAYGKYLKFETAVVFGGVGIEPQKRALKRGVDVLVATPGRLLDLVGQGYGDFSNLEILVLDEADRMLDMGFLPDVKRILRLLKKERQNILFSATVPKDIADLSQNLLKNPVRVEVAPQSSTSEQVEQSLYYVRREKKRDLLLTILDDETTTRVLVFTRTKSIANRITKFLIARDITSEAIHGNKSQGARQRALENFKVGKTRVLVASDLAARGLDVDGISHVVNFDLPNVAETYVHRIGRTGRAAAVGKAISLSDAEEQAYVVNIERVIGKKIPVVTGHPNELTAAEMAEGKRAGPPKQGSQGRRRPPNPRARPRAAGNRARRR